jgi:hypothetical protein
MRFMLPWVPSFSRAALAAGALALALGLHGASAETPYTGFFVCSVKPTSDGFVALRSGPSAESRMITRIIPGHMVVIERKGYAAIESGNWSLVSHYTGEVFPKPEDPAYKNVRKGWVNSRFIAECG